MLSIQLIDQWRLELSLQDISDIKAPLLLVKPDDQANIILERRIGATGQLHSQVNLTVAGTESG